MSSYLSTIRIKKQINKRENLQVRPVDILRNKGACLKASLTVEAALVLPLILLSLILLMMPLHMMNADHQMQVVCEEVAGDVSKYMYSVNEMHRGRLSSTDSTVSTYADITDGAGLGAYAAMRIKSRISDERLRIVNVLDSDIGRQDDMVTVRIDYAYKLPFNVFRLGFLQQQAVASRRSWVGAEGSVKSGGAEQTDDEWVYIGKNPTRYHLTPDCHYLSNDWTKAVVGSNGKAAGKKACDICARNAAVGQTVYITPNGDKYHTDTSCSAMRAYPQMVRKSEVEYLGCCSYCAKHAE